MEAQGQIKKISLSKGYYALIDEEMVTELSKYSWHVSGEKDGYYAKTDFWNSGDRKSIYMHRFVYEKYFGEIPKDMFIDHKNRNRLDNRISNLRLATKSENTYNRRRQNNNNSSKYKGVYLNKQSGSYVAYVSLNGKRTTIGSYNNEIACANAYNHYAKNMYGEFAFLNDVPYMSEDEVLKYQKNTSCKNKYKGIVKRKDTGKYRIILYDLDGKKINLGQCNTENEALAVRNNYLMKNKHLFAKYNLES